VQFKLLESDDDMGTEQVLQSVQETSRLPPVERLLEQYPDIFTDPSSMPSPRPFDHSIPLLPGATPVNIRSYRYSPAQKDKIEKQLIKMLQNRIIKHSSNPYASPVLLVRKKDGSWRFYVDYRHLNA
jgi:hypothetical protein